MNVLEKTVRTEYRCNRCGKQFFNMQQKHFSGGHICEGTIIEQKWVLLEEAQAREEELKQKLREHLKSMPHGMAEPGTWGAGWLEELWELLK